MNRIALSLLSLSITLIISACGGDSAPSQNIPTQSTNNSTPIVQEDSSVQSSNSEKVLVTVNGEAITQTEFERAFVRVAGNSDASDTSTLAVQILNTLIEQEVIVQAAGRMQIAVTDGDVENEISTLKNSVAQNNTSWDAWLASNQYTEDELRSALHDSILTNRVRDKVIADLGDNVQQSHARHILVATEAEAKTVLDRLGKGEDFGALAAELSLDVTTRDFGGDLGWFMREELLDTNLADVAFNLESGEIAGPIVTRIGYHIIQTLEKGMRPVEPERMPFLIENVFNRWLDEQMSSAKIERFQ